ncbi:MAG TPA: hypothetical protein VEK57_00335 [Thermoanaerobaculia bacterium]|nr:hypothetical protein [Thermoanaerobaculia bacterium]
MAALIAIMTAEGKIENVSGAPKLRLLVPRNSLSDYERGFVDALFINGNEIVEQRQFEQQLGKPFGQQQRRQPIGGRRRRWVVSGLAMEAGSCSRTLTILRMEPV